MMKYPKGCSKTIILVPYPAQGHVTPMLKLATVFLTQGFRPILVTPGYIHRKIASRAHPEGVVLAAIPDGIAEDAPRDFFSVEQAMEHHMPAHLERLIGEYQEEQQIGGGDVACVVVDLLASWAIAVARRCGVPVAGFWPAMLATYRLISAVPEMVRSGLISDTGNPQHDLGGAMRFLPNQPTLSAEELPWLIGTPAARRARFKFWTRTLARSRTLRCVLANSFPDESLAAQPDHHHHHHPTLLPIGPLRSHPARAASFWDEDATCLDWLDERAPGSVVYISFGSWVSPISEAKARSLAAALDSLGLFFVWVLGASWRAGLPEGFAERVRANAKGRGKIVSWAPQVEVLRHRSVGFYLTHCGWNSTMEAIQCQKRMLCCPIAGDQFLNCNYIEKVWKIGVRMGGFGKRDLEEGMRKVVEDKEMGSRLRKLCERVMGDEAGLRARSNLAKFLDFLGKQTGLEQAVVLDDCGGGGGGGAVEVGL